MRIETKVVEEKNTYNFSNFFFF